ncbi:hypothetical protein SR02_004028 [Salmonella enterica subsp. arizonae]|nr:hypothetical protein [Salmonella enterica subsp. arizonae]EKD5485782.1 hypothetical protein [Salmonella enterica subsp. arizonae]HDY3839704.1 hypothetical protein [Salmonella enterica]
MTAKNEPENDGKTADNAFEINCDRVRMVAKPPFSAQRPGYSSGTAVTVERRECGA